MANVLNSWTSGVVVSVIIGTIIEMILPEGNSKKYIKMVIGVFILFTIISPVLSNIFGDIDLKQYINFDEYTDLAVSTSTSIIEDEDVLDIYKQNIKSEIINTVKQNGFNVVSIDIKIDTAEESYGQISKIILRLEESDNTIEKVEKVKVNVSNSNSNNKKISESKKKELINVLYSTYGVKKENVVINE